MELAWDVEQQEGDNDETQDEHTDSKDFGDVDWDNVSSDSSEHGPRGEFRAQMQPASKRSRSTQVSDEFVRRRPAVEPPSGAAQDDLCKDQMERLEVIIELLEQLAKAGLPTLINAFQRSGNTIKSSTPTRPLPTSRELETGTCPWQDPCSVRH